MFFQLSEAILRLVIEELRSYWQYHPKYEDLIDSIQGKNSQKERPYRGIIVRSSSANQVTLSADNYMGVVKSYVHLTKVKNKPGTSLEWCREDSIAIQNNGGVFPSHTGVYYIDVVEAQDKSQPYTHEFYVDPLWDINRELISMETPTTGKLKYPPVFNSERIYEYPAGYKLIRGIDYYMVMGEDKKPTGEFVLSAPMSSKRWLSVDYKHEQESLGPFPILEQQANTQAIPGVVLVFGRRIVTGDQFAIVVDSKRQPVSLQYGGRWEVSIEAEAFSKDVHEPRELVDSSMVFLYGVARSRLATYGIEIKEVSQGGESEEAFDETADEYEYTSSFNMTVETDWSIYVPLDVYIREVHTYSSGSYAGLSDEEIATVSSNIRMLGNMNLEMATDPYFTNKYGTFSRIM